MLIEELNQAGTLDGEKERELGEAITTAIFTLVKNRAERAGGTLDPEPVLRGIACAYAAAAYGLNDHDLAKELLLELAEAMDNPATRRRVLFGDPNDPGKPPAEN